MISTEIADIFRSNSLKNGLLPIVVGEDDASLAARAIPAPRSRSICPPIMHAGCPTARAVPFPIESFARYCLLNGIDELGLPARATATRSSVTSGAAAMKARIAVLGGDGIGPEVTAEAVRCCRPSRPASTTSSSSPRR